MRRSRRSAAAIVSYFDGWARADEMRGCQHPDIRDEIHNAYERARERLIQHLMKD